MVRSLSKRAMTYLLIAVVVAALIFDFSNGFHDAANAIATAITTRALSPTTALTLAAVLDVVGALLSTAVAATIAKQIVDPQVVTLPILFAGLMGAIFWNFFTWYHGIPSSSSHCLVGGTAGAVAVGYGLAGVQWSTIVTKVLVPTVASPLLGFLGGSLLTVLLSWLLRRSHPRVANRRFKILQILSSSVMALSHGLNDAQKTMGIITLALFASGGLQTMDVPTWVKVSCAVSMGLGTFIGGKRIIATLGMKLAKINSVDGFAAQTAASAVLQGAAYFGLPISTTHVATATILGVGSTHRLKAVRWSVTQRIALAWVLTLPASALAGALVVGALRVCGVG